MQRIKVHLVKPRKQRTVIYEGVILLEEPGHLLVHARWERQAMDLGYVVFAPGDHFFEHYYTERWYNVFEVRSAAGDLKGWYCNITRPACVAGDVLTSEDLELEFESTQNLHSGDQRHANVERSETCTTHQTPH